MDRKTQQRALESRKKLTETALQLFSQKGFYNTNIREITRTSGLSTGIFYHYFDNKESLYKTLVEEYLNESYELMRQIVVISEKTATKEDAELELNKILTYLLDRADNANSLLSDAEILKKTITGLEEVIHTGVDKIISCIEDYLTHKYADRDMNYRVTARMIYLVTDTISRDMLKEENKEMRDEYMKVFVAEIMHYWYEL